MQRALDPLRPVVHGTRFVAPARAPGGRPFLARTIVGVAPSIPRAAREAAQREPSAALRRAARSITVVRQRPRPAAARRLPQPPWPG